MAPLFYCSKMKQISDVTSLLIFLLFGRAMCLWSALYHLDMTQLLSLLLIVHWPEGVISQPKGLGPIPSKELKSFHDSSKFVEKCFLGKNIPEEIQ